MKDRYRFAGPCDRNEVPYKRPAILKFTIDDVEQPHVVIQFKRLPTQRHLYFYSEADEYFSANWVGNHADLCALIEGDMLCYGNMRIQMTPQMSRLLLQPPSIP